jgi:hypothetical protein
MVKPGVVIFVGFESKLLEKDYLHEAAPTKDK